MDKIDLPPLTDDQREYLEGLLRGEVIRNDIQDVDELAGRLLEAGSTGLDLSPGDPLCSEAARALTALQAERDEARTQVEVMEEALENIQMMVTHTPVVSPPAEAAAINRIIVSALSPTAGQGVMGMVKALEWAQKELCDRCYNDVPMTDDTDGVDRGGRYHAIRDARFGNWNEVCKAWFIREALSSYRERG